MLPNSNETPKFLKVTILVFRSVNKWIISLVNPNKIPILQGYTPSKQKGIT